MSAKSLVIDAAAGMLSALYALCRLLPTRQRMVCISRQSDRKPVDFQLIRAWCATEEPGWDVVVLARALRSPLSYLPEMVRQVYYLATSRLVVLDSYCIVVGLLNRRIKAPVVQIWHALGNMKKFGYMTLDTPEGHSSATARLMHMHEGYDAVAVSSMSFADDLAAGFGADPSIVFEAPLPRVDLLLDSEHRQAQRETFLATHPEAAGREVIVYCPTFRKSEPPEERAAMEALLSAIDFSRYALVFKPHPVSRQVIDDPRVIRVDGGPVDPLYAADYVISDYSTVIYEAGLLDVPVYLYAYDWASYQGKRTFNIDLEHDVPTLFTPNANEIMSAIENHTFDHEAFQAFVAHNIALPTEGSCTGHLCRKIMGINAKEQHQSI